MNFIEAVEQMKKGRVMSMPNSSWGYKFRVEPVYKGIIQYSNQGEEVWTRANMVVNYLTLEWDFYEEPKLTLFNKASRYEGEGEGRTFEYNDVKAALKEFIINSGMINNNEYKELAEKIFGKELLE